MARLTELETIVRDAIENHTCEEDMETVDIHDLKNITGIETKALRGVVSSLVKKDEIIVEEYPVNLETIHYFYWIKEH